MAPRHHPVYAALDLAAALRAENRVADELAVVRGEQVVRDDAQLDAGLQPPADPEIRVPVRVHLVRRKVGRPLDRGVELPAAVEVDFRTDLDLIAGRFTGLADGRHVLASWCVVKV